MDWGAWEATVHGVTKSRTRLSDITGHRMYLARLCAKYCLGNNTFTLHITFLLLFISQGISTTPTFQMRKQDTERLNCSLGQCGYKICAPHPHSAASMAHPESMAGREMVQEYPSRCIPQQALIEHLLHVRYKDVMTSQTWQQKTYASSQKVRENLNG